MSERYADQRAHDVAWMTAAGRQALDERPPECLSAEETARLARAALAAEFPGVEFGIQVHGYDGGTSMSVRWAGGPERDAVDAVVQQYAGAEFDGMTEEKVPRPVWRRVQFGTDYVFTERYDTARAA
jgi:hypothetical protein